MATSCRRRRQGVPATAPKFIKIILNPESDTLRIPKEFTRRHGQNLRNRLLLKVPEGSVMEVELIQSSSNGETWLQKGWVGFVERYSIGFGYLIVFSYNGNSQFDVLIFDPTATEISYPVEGTRSQSDSDDLILENPEVSRNPPLATDGETRKRFPSKAKTVAKETCIAYQKALAYKSCISANKSNTTSQQKPFFISLMQQSYVSHNYILHVPVSFAKTCLLSFGINNLHLMTNGRKWHVICWVRRGFRKANLSSGWKKFAQDNELKVGDACIFEAPKSGKLVWNVMVFRSCFEERVNGED